jgi:hypothetical protein
VETGSICFHRKTLRDKLPHNIQCDAQFDEGKPQDYENPSEGFWDHSAILLILTPPRIVRCDVRTTRFPTETVREAVRIVG